MIKDYLKVNLKQKLTFITFGALLLAAFFTTNTEAKLVEIVETAEYTVGDNESRNAASEAAISLARRRASEKVGVYVESYSKTEDFTLAKDQVKTISATLMKDKQSPVIVSSLNEQGRMLLKATVDVIIDTDTIDGYIKNLKTPANTNKSTEYKDLKESYKQLEEKFNLLLESINKKEAGSNIKAQVEKEPVKAANAPEVKKPAITNSPAQPKPQNNELLMEIEDYVQELKKHSPIDINSGDKLSYLYRKLSVIAEFKKQAAANNSAFIKTIDPDTGGRLNKTKWCRFYEIDYLPTTLSITQNHEISTWDDHKGYSCWNWVPVELGGIGNIHIRYSADKKSYEFYTDKNNKTKYKMKITPTKPGLNH